MVSKQIIHYITIAFSLLWILFIVTDYLYYHPSYYLSIVKFELFDLLIANLFAGSIIGYFVINRKSIKSINTKFSLFNGVGISFLFLFISATIIKVQAIRTPSSSGIPFSDILTYLGTLSTISLSTYFVFLVCYCLGNFLLLKFFSVRHKQLEESLISIVLGIILVSLFSFFAAALSIFTLIPTWIFFLLTPLLLWKHALQFIKITFFSNVFKSKQIGWLGFVCFYIILFIISRTCLQNVRPYPFGFDALRLYLNLPKLIAERGELVMGHSPYYWSLFISLGHVLFNKIEVVISLSSSGGILSALCIYAISNKWLNRDFSLLVVLLFLSLPMINFLASSDVKDDLGLLFFHLVAFLVLINFIEFPVYHISEKRPILGKKKSRTSKKKNILPKTTFPLKSGLFKELITNEKQLIIIMGLITGGSLGIKLTSLIFIFSSVSVLFLFKTKSIGFLTSIILVFAFILIAGLDVSSGLRAYHLGTDWFRWIVLGVGLLGVAYLLYSYKTETIELFKLCTIYGAIIILIYIPWPIKNYTETKVFSFETFISGKKVEAPPIK